MNLILDLQQDILDSHVELSSILRKAKVLALTLKNRELKVWADNELNGYYNEDEVPKYREFSANNRGNFIVNYSSQLNNAPISLLCIPAGKIRDELMKHEIRGGVKTLESSIRSGEKEFRYRWPAELLHVCSESFYQNSSCLDAWKAISVYKYEQILDDIRTRLLDFLIELQEKYPEIQESSSLTQKIPEKEVSKIFITTVYGGQCSVGNHFDNCQSVQQFVQKNDLKSLLEFLNKIGVPSIEIDNLETSIQKDSQDKKSKDIGSNVKNWISNLSVKVLSSAVDKTLDIPLDVIKMAILAYYGLK